MPCRALPLAGVHTRCFGDPKAKRGEPSSCNPGLCVYRLLLWPTNEVSLSNVALAAPSSLAITRAGARGPNKRQNVGVIEAEAVARHLGPLSWPFWRHAFPSDSSSPVSCFPSYFDASCSWQYLLNCPDDQRETAGLIERTVAHAPDRRGALASPRNRCSV